MVEAEARSRDWMLTLIGLAALILFALLALLTLWLLFFAPALAGLVCLVAGLTPMSGRAKSRRFLAGIISIVVIFAVTLVLLQFANRLGYPVKIVVPDGYKGKVWIVVDKTKGQTPQLIDGVWVFNIPPSGTLLVNDESPFEPAHEEDYYFADGQRINVTAEDWGSDTSTDQTRFWALIS